MIPEHELLHRTTSLRWSTSKADIYSAHLPASPGGMNEQLRLDGVEVIRADGDLLPDDGQAVDPLGTGSWAGEPHAVKHTQSPRDNGANFCGLAPGGMDDRFDHQLVTDEWLDGDGLDLVPDTYRTLGNDGMHFDVAINDGDNF